MKEIIEKIIQLVENSEGDQGAVEKKLNEFYESNKNEINNSSSRLSEKLDQAMMELKGVEDFNIIMQTMFKVITDEIGEGNFKKIMELQQKYPYLKSMTKKIIPN